MWERRDLKPHGIQHLPLWLTGLAPSVRMSAAAPGTAIAPAGGSVVPMVMAPMPAEDKDEGEAGEEGEEGKDGKPQDNAARLARLARKAESARLARLRHKQYVADKQGEVTLLQKEEDSLLKEESTAATAALVSVRQELRKTLTEEQLQACGSSPVYSSSPSPANSGPMPPLDPFASHPTAPRHCPLTTLPHPAADPHWLAEGDAGRNPARGYLPRLRRADGPSAASAAPKGGGRPRSWYGGRSRRRQTRRQENASQRRQAASGRRRQRRPRHALA